MPKEIGVQEITVVVFDDCLNISFGDSGISVDLNDMEIEVLNRLIKIAQKLRKEGDN